MDPVQSSKEKGSVLFSITEEPGGHYVKGKKPAQEDDYTISDVETKKFELRNRSLEKYLTQHHTANESPARRAVSCCSQYLCGSEEIDPCLDKQSAGTVGLMASKPR